MKKREGINSKEILFIGIISIIFCLGLVFAAHSVVKATGGTNFTFNEDAYNIYNFTINITSAAGTDNLTQVNITIPANFTFVARTNGSNFSSAPLGNNTFANTTTVLSWTNSSSYYLINATGNSSIWFNATCATPANYTITMTTVSNGTNLTVITIPVYISDITAPPTITFASPSTTGNGNFSKTEIVINATITDNWILDTINVSLYNKTSGLILNSSSNSTLGGANKFYINFSGLPEGNYTYNVTVNDSSGNVNRTLRTVYLDTTAPTGTLSCSPSSPTTADTVTCTCTGSDASGTTTTAINPASNWPVTVGSHTISCTITDYAGNTHQANTTYSVTDASGGSSSNSGGSIVSKWVKTIKLNDSTLNLGQTLKKLKEDYRLTFNVKGMGHYVGITSMTSTTATIEVASTPQTATLVIGDSRKFDIDADGYYDISVKLNSITGNEADLVVTQINEKISVETTTAQQEQESNAAAVAEPKEETTPTNLTWVWILVIVVIVLIIIWVVYKQKSNKHKRK